jgi:NADPH2:quinone reductase
MSRIVRFHELGGPEKLRIEDIPERDPGPGEVRIKVDAFALNRADLMYLTMTHAVAPQLPSRIGFEAVGVVDSVGEGVTAFKPGDRVANVPYGKAGYEVAGETAILPDFTLVPVNPKLGLSLEEQTSVWMQYMTGWGALFSFGHLQADDTVLITAGSSSASIGAIQLAKDAGAQVIATTRTRAKADFIRSVGADHVVVTDEEQLGPAVKAITGGKGARLIYDCIAGQFFDNLIDSVAVGGQIMVYGALDTRPFHINIAKMVWTEATFRPYSMITVFNDPVRRKAGLNYISGRLAAGAFRPVVDRVFMLDEIVDAYRYMLAGNHKGKIVVRVN